MSRASRRPLVFVLVGGLVVAAFAGGIAFERYRTTYSITLGEPLVATWAAQTALIQYCEGSSEAAEEALLDYVSLLDELRSRDNPFISERTVAVDTTLSFARLAKVRRDRGDSAGADRYLTKARERCEETAWKDCSDDRILAILARFDRSSIFCSPPAKMPSRERLERGERPPKA